MLTPSSGGKDYIGHISYNLSSYKNKNSYKGILCYKNIMSLKKKVSNDKSGIKKLFIVNFFWIFLKIIPAKF